MDFSKFDRIIIKVSSSVLFDEELKGLKLSWFHSFIEDVVKLYRKNKEIMIVSSGAVAMGKPYFKDFDFSNPIVRRSLASIGQIFLMSQYHEALRNFNIRSSQILFSLKDSYDPLYSQNLIETIGLLLERHCLPVINENDVIAPVGFTVRDNDFLSAYIAGATHTDLLILLSDVKGLYDKDPKLNPDAKLIKYIDQLNETFFFMLGSSTSIHGTGGMKSKLSATELALKSGCNVIIADGNKYHPIQAILETEECTFFKHQNEAKASTFQLDYNNEKPDNGIVLNKNGVQALKHKSSLEFQHIIQVKGDFPKHHHIALIDQNKKLVGNGIVEESSDAIRTILNNLVTIDKNFGKLWDKRVMLSKNCIFDMN